jgi:hypothetical protein
VTKIDVIGPQSLGGSSSALVLGVDDVDDASAQGRTVWTYRQAGEPFGHIWFIHA